MSPALRPFLSGTPNMIKENQLSVFSQGASGGRDQISILEELLV